MSAKPMNEHPGKTLAGWLKEKRQRKGFSARVFAGRIGLSPAKYAEVEVGIVKWIEERQQLLISKILDFTPDDDAFLNHHLYLSGEAGHLKFDEIFTREQLAPARLCNFKGERLTPEKREAILDAVFTPLD
jgi:transcriptional regulator with XRE-family HTH domain